MASKDKNDIVKINKTMVECQPHFKPPKRGCLNIPFNKNGLISK